MHTLTPEKDGYTRTYRKLVMYKDLNAQGSIFGGTLVSWMDEAAAIFSGETVGTRRIVTKKISELIFEVPAKLGDLLEIWCKPIKKGKTSLTTSVLVLRRMSQDESKEHVAEICCSEFVFVAIDENGRPVEWKNRIKVLA